MTMTMTTKEYETCRQCARDGEWIFTLFAHRHLCSATQKEEKSSDDDDDGEKDGEDQRWSFQVLRDSKATAVSHGYHRCAFSITVHCKSDDADNYIDDNHHKSRSGIINAWKLIKELLQTCSSIENNQLQLSKIFCQTWIMQSIAFTVKYVFRDNFLLL